MISANIQEIFASIQGEGKYVGKPMIFVRFCTCNLRCNYCDTKRSWKKTTYCRVEKIPFSNRWQKIPNDLTSKQAAEIIRQYPKQTISFTGGEPLLNAEFIAELIKLLGKKYTYLLETNGTLITYLPILKNSIDIYSVDLKSGFEKEFLSFYKKIPKAKEKYVKIILEHTLKIPLLTQTLKKGQVTQVYLQPESGKIKPSLLIPLISALNKANISYLLIPQIHKFINIK